MQTDPIQFFSQWLAEAKAHPAIAEPTAMCLATADSTGAPSARIVLLKGLDERGFVFYTNLESAKSIQLKSNPRAALCFYWMPLDRQVRIEGHAEAVSDKEADQYFATRPRESRIGAWSSKQSRLLADHQELVDSVKHYTELFEGKEVTRPPFWSGWRIIPQRIEFWQQGEFRLHERDVFLRKNNGWDKLKLYP
jgi:pyridoxamine 5'-phosphate oxidase